jgi:hypothetical protein
MLKGTYERIRMSLKNLLALVTGAGCHPCFTAAGAASARGGSSG